MPDQICPICLHTLCAGTFPADCRTCPTCQSIDGTASRRMLFDLLTCAPGNRVWAWLN